MEKNQLLELASKISEGTATDAEIALYNTFFNSFQNKDGVWDEQLMGNREAIERELAERINSKIEHSPHQGKVRRLYYTVASSAAILCLIAFSIFYFSTPIPKESKLLVRTPATLNSPAGDINPGGKRALLTLADGTMIDLDSVPTGAVVRRSDLVISKQEDGQLLYEVISDNTERTNSELTYNTLSTPRGGQYQIVLPDGSKVWLNAMSSLKFPIAFHRNERKVQLTGEGYFEVTKNREAPFIVSLNQCDVEVLGTCFNIDAYSTDESTTTLLTGSVKVSLENQERFIKPGQKALVNKTIAIEKADTELAIAWKNGFMSFENEDIRSIMEKVSRWYDVEVVYAGKIPDRKFTGEISNHAKLSELLMILELSDIHFRIENRKVIISS